MNTLYCRLCRQYRFGRFENFGFGHRAMWITIALFIDYSCPRVFMRMTVSIRSFRLLLPLVLLASTVMAAEDKNAQAIAGIKAVFANSQPNMEVHSVKPSPVAGLYEVEIQGGQTVYVSADAKFFIPGDLYEAKSDGLVNLGEQHRNEIRRDKIAAVKEKDMIIFAPKGERKATLTVFTDVDCPYCRKLHGEIEELNKLGIAVRYLAYPRTGLKGETYERMISTWCAKDRKAVFTQAKLGNDIPVVKCDSPVEEEFQLGVDVGVTGTPAVVLEDGTMLPGYVPAQTMASYLFGDHAD